MVGLLYKMLWVTRRSQRLAVQEINKLYHNREKTKNMEVIIKMSRAGFFTARILGSTTLVISTVDDPMALYKNGHPLADQIPNDRRVAVPDGGHLLLGYTNKF